MKKQVNRNYKDTVFRMLFKEAKNALALYNSLNGTHYTDAAMLEYNTKEQSLYGSRLQKIPVPTFVVFYNGTEEMEERMELRLSDAYEFPVQDPALELKVRHRRNCSWQSRELWMNVFVRMF